MSPQHNNVSIDYGESCKATFTRHQTSFSSGQVFVLIQIFVQIGFPFTRYGLLLSVTIREITDFLG